MIREGHAFYCDCPARNAKIEGYSQIIRDPCRDQRKTNGAIKLRVPDNQKISFKDFVFREEITWDTNKVFDATLLKSDGFPTYHLAAMVDDHLMNISHILRGYDWMSSTPIHLLVLDYLGFERPQIGHLTDIQAPQGGKLSKRKGSTSIDQFIEDGYLPEALFNFVILMGWAPKDNRELFTLDEFVQYFREDGFQKSNPRYVPDKLDWFNAQYIRKIDEQDLISRIKKFTNKDEATIGKLLPLIKDRMVTLKEFDQLIEYFFVRPQIQVNNFGVLTNTINVLTETWDGKVLEEKARAYCSENNVKVGDYFMVLRQAITGRSQTPPLWDVMQILGKEEVLARLKSCLPEKEN